MQVEDATHRCVALNLGSSRCTSLTETPPPADCLTHVAHTEHRHTSTSPLCTVGSATLPQYPGYLPDAPAGVSPVGANVSHRQKTLSSS
jgi:hypothetical protein